MHGFPGQCGKPGFRDSEATDLLSRQTLFPRSASQEGPFQSASGLQADPAHGHRSPVAADRAIDSACERGSEWPAQIALRRAVDGLQIRYDIKLSAEHYVSTEAWRVARLEACPNHPDGGCTFASHGTYERKTLGRRAGGAMVLPGVSHLFSLLPDCLAARKPGTLDAVEAAFAGSPVRSLIFRSAGRGLVHVRDNLATFGPRVSYEAVAAARLEVVGQVLGNCWNVESLSLSDDASSATVVVFFDVPRVCFRDDSFTGYSVPVAGSIRMERPRLSRPRDASSSAVARAVSC